MMQGTGWKNKGKLLCLQTEWELQMLGTANVILYISPAQVAGLPVYGSVNNAERFGLFC